MVFNTVLSGYQEVITDPSYAGQIITFTYPHIGNYGVNDHDFESARPFCRGVIVREMARRHSNQRAEDSLDAMLRRFGVSGIAGIDTRRLTRLLRDTGAMPGAFGTADRGRHCGRPPPPSRAPTASTSSPRSPRPRRYVVRRRPAAHRRLRLRHQDHHPAPPRPSSARSRSCPRPPRAAEVLAPQPDGVFLTNGPGDPAMVGYAVDTIGRTRRPGAGLRHLPRPPAAQPGARRRDLQAALRPPRRQPPRAPRGHRPRRDHQPEPQLLRRPGQPRRQGRGHPPQPQRLHQRGHAGARRAGVQRAVPPRGRPRPARQPLPVRDVRRPHGCGLAGAKAGV